MKPRRRDPHPLPRSALPPPVRATPITITAEMLMAYRRTRDVRGRCRCSSYGGPPCKAHVAAAAAEVSLRHLLGLEPWQHVTLGTVEPGASAEERAAVDRFWLLERALVAERRAKRAAG